MAMPIPVSELIPALVIIAVAAAVQGVVGIGFNVLAVPALLLVDPILAPVPNLLLAVPLTIWQVVRERGTIDRSGVAWIITGRFPGALIGLWLLLTLSDELLQITIAVIVLGAVLVVWRGSTVRRTPVTEVGAGIVSGITGIVGAIGGPPVGLLYRDAPPAVMRPTVAVVFTIGISLSLGMRAIGGRMGMDDVRIALLLLPAMVFGFWVSGRVKDRVPPRLVRNGILVVSAMASLALLVRNLL